MRQPFICIGIDPGVSGAIVIFSFDDFGDRNELIEIYDMPLLPKPVDEKYNKHDPRFIYQVLEQYKSDRIIAVIEKVGFDWRDDGSKKSAEVLIRSHESVLTILAVLGIETHNLHPHQWRKLAGCSGLTDDKLIVDRALQLFPDARSQLKRRSTRAKAGYVYEHDRAEALLMAHAGRVILEKRSRLEAAL